MPLVTEITRQGETIVPGDNGWDGVLLGAMYTVALGEGCPDERVNDDYTWGEALAAGKMVSVELLPIYYLPYDAPICQVGRHTVLEDHTFEVGGYNDDDEFVVHRTLEFKAGDVLCAHREMK